MGWTICPKTESITHRSRCSRRMPVTAPSSSTPSRMRPPWKLARAATSLASCSGRTSSRLNSSPEFSPPAISSRRSERFVVPGPPRREPDYRPVVARASRRSTRQREPTTGEIRVPERSGWQGEERKRTAAPGDPVPPFSRTAAGSLRRRTTQAPGEDWPYATTPSTIFPWTSVSRKFRPWYG